MGQVVREAPEMMRLEFQREGVKLHATVMNAGFLSRYAEEEESSREMEVYRGRRRQKPRDNFDATRLFEVGVIWARELFLNILLLTQLRTKPV